MDLDFDPTVLMPDAFWQELFTPPHLDWCKPKRGDTGDPIPTLEVRFLDHPTGQDALALMVLAHEDWNVYEARREMMATLGEQWAERQWKVYALRLASAAWLREMTPEEEAARAGRKIETYPDKRECMVVFGATIDHRVQMAYAHIQRDARQRVRGMGAWQHWPADAMQTSPLLECAWAGYLQRYLGLFNPALLAQIQRVRREVN
jgi:hypothetical protein